MSRRPQVASPRRSSRLAAARTVGHIAARQLWARKLLNGIAVLGVTLGVAVFVAMPALMRGYQVMFLEIMLKTSSHVVIRDAALRSATGILDRLYPAPLVARVAHEVPSDRQERIKSPDGIVASLQSRPEVEAAAASLPGVVLAEYGARTKSLDLHGIELMRQDRVTPLLPFVVEGRLAALAAVPDSIAVGAGVARELGLRLGDVLHVAAPGGQPLALKVVALLEFGVPPVDRSRAYVRLHTAQALLGLPDTIGRVEVRLRDPADAARLAPVYERLFGYRAESWQETNANYLSLFATQNAVIAFVIGAILLVGGFGILAALLMIVLQKRRDIAILRSIGLRRRDVLWAFLLQGVAVAGMGGLLGDALAKLAIWAIPHLRLPVEGVIKASSLPVHEDGRFYVWGLAFAVVLGAAAACLPAWHASRVEPVQVLRGQAG